jgi:hypothetical protein
MLEVNFKNYLNNQFKLAYVAIAQARIDFALADKSE